MDLPPLRNEAHYGDRVVPCFLGRPSHLHALLAANVAARPHAEALVCGPDRLTWAGLDGRAARLAGGMRARGIGRGDRVGLLLGNQVEFVVALWAVARLGAISVPMGTRLSAPEIAHNLADCAAAGLLFGAEWAQRVPEALPTLRWRAAAPWPDLLDAPADPVPVAEEDTAIILYTSGTTGRPKGAMLTGLGLVHSSLVYAGAFRLGPADRGLAAVPLSHVTGLVGLITAMAAAGGTLLVLPEFRAATFLEFASRERMTHTIMVPAMYTLCLLQPGLDTADLSAWRVGGFGGAPMPPATVDALAARLPGLLLVNVYGSTESTSPATMRLPAEPAAPLDSVGRPCPGTAVMICDESGRELPPDHPGEIWLHGPNVAPGYWNDPGATSRNIVAGWWRSGDLGAVDAGGNLRVLDRIKDMLNRGGYKIYSAEVEAALAAHPAVVESAVVGRPCPVLGERVHAVVVLRGEGVAPADLGAHCAARLADYRVPETFDLRLDPLPRNANGKVLKRDLRPQAMPARPA